ncbi:amino acid racemase [Pseudomonas sp. 7P_10.2_Bac1]|uniref:aspartate/glutamate racemase family protein n=1 Tax=Pseudomonas sp. 7P_10.2_Bac1 TaxID=2971614 RepID=UPI0021C7E06E|nr:amino acid racemase [Pseudomonas sp. 7P_10.2_Bac1]MCU1726794.1 amino acid racemase [Pseudomonas sp. 7P_10.2_Bac1]
MSDRTVGIIGGMGPEATVDLMSKVINLTPAKDDADHIRMIVDNNPKIPSRIKALIDKTGESPAPALVQIAQSLQAYGADFIVIPCNTAHHYYSDVAQAVTIPVLNMLELVVSHVRLKQPQIKKVGLLASTAVIGLKLYDRLFADHGIEVVAPQTPVQQTVMDSILQIKSGIKDHTTVAVLNEAIKHLETQGAECIIIACTELSVIERLLHSETDIYDAAHLLAEEIVTQAKTNN